MKAGIVLVLGVTTAMLVFVNQIEENEAKLPKTREHGKMRCSTVGRFIGLSGLECNLNKLLQESTAEKNHKFSSLIDKARTCLEHPHAFEKSCKNRNDGISLFPTLV